MPELRTHGNESDHVADTGQVQATLAQRTILHDVEEHVIATAVADHIQEVEELFTDALVDAGARIHRFEARRRLDMVIERRVEFANTNITT